MDTIDTFLNAMFAPYPATPRLQEAKAELRAMMEDAYADAIASGRTYNEAVGKVITDFGNLDELAEALGIAGDLRAGSQAGSATADVGSAAVGVGAAAGIGVDNATGVGAEAGIDSAAAGVDNAGSPEPSAQPFAASSGSAASQQAPAANQHTSPAPEQAPAAPEQALAPREPVKGAPAAGFATEGFAAEGFATSAFAAPGPSDDPGSEHASYRQRLKLRMHRLYRTWRAEPSTDEVFIILAGIVWWLTSLAIYLVFIVLKVWVAAWIIWPLSGVLFNAFIGARFNWRETFVYQAGVIWWSACLAVLLVSIFIPTSWHTSWAIWLVSGVLLGALAGRRSWRAHLRSRVLQ